MSVVEGWSKKRLIDLADYINGYAFKPNDWGADGLKIIRIEQLKNPDAESDYFAGKLPADRIIEDGDLLFSWSASLFLKIWRHGRAALNQHLFKVLEKEGVDRIFLKQFIEYHLPELTKASHGSTMQHITRKELERFDAIFPDDEREQSKIAEILSTVDRAIEQTEALIAKQQRIKTGLMQDLLTRGIDEQGNLRSEQTHKFKDSPLGRIPEGWDVKPLGEICERVTNGFVGVATPYYTDSSTGIPYLYGTNIKLGSIDLSGLRYVNQSFHRRQLKSQLRAGDMLTVQSGHIGTTAVVPEDFGEANCHALIISRFKSGVVNPEFVSMFCNYCLETGAMSKLFIGSTIKHINTSELAKFDITLPSVSEQNNTAKLVSKSQEVINATSAQLKKLRSLKQSLMQDLLTGEKRVTPLLETADAI